MSEIKINNFNDNFGFYKKEEAKKEQPEEKQTLSTHQGSAFSVSPDKMLDAMSLLGAQNITSINKAQVNPTDFLTDEQIASIEASMKQFEKGTEKYVGLVKEEFGNILGEKAVYALAAETFAKEN